MPDVNITYKGASIATMDASGTKTLETGGKYCEGDITVAYTKPSSGITPSGSISITTNGTHDVTNYASANVNVPQGITPSGTKQITIAANGTTTEDVTNYASAAITVNVPSQSIDAYVADVTLATHTSTNVPLCTLPDNVYAHKDDTNFAVMLLCTDPSSLSNGDDFMVMASNNPNLAVASSSIPFYGIGYRRNGTAANKMDVFYPPNAANNNTSYGGIGKFWMNGKVLTYKSNQYWLGAGTFRVVVTW